MTINKIRGEQHDLKMKVRSAKMTKNRVAIVEELKKLTNHPTADELFGIVKKHHPRISLGTLYRNLALLSQLEVIRKIDAGDKSRFDGNTCFHYHARCNKCDKLIDLPDKYNKQKIVTNAIEDDFVITGYRLEFFGICKKCSIIMEELDMERKTDELSNDEKAILTVLESMDLPVGTKDIAAGSNIESKKISNAVKKLKTKGFVETPARCKYAITEKGKQQLSR